MDDKNNQALLATPDATHNHSSHFAIAHHPYINNNICHTHCTTCVVILSAVILNLSHEKLLKKSHIHVSSHIYIGALCEVDNLLSNHANQGIHHNILTFQSLNATVSSLSYLQNIGIKFINDQATHSTNKFSKVTIH
ncbi:hypothetical protein J5751_03530 [bacterium]|nr:hypothetical protein [bacterium]